MAKQIDLDADNPRYTPFSLMEYTSGMTEETGIRIVESRTAATASVNVDNKTITIPAIDYSQPMTRERYRITKGFIDHEIAHILHPDPSYLNVKKDRQVLNIANLIDDIRIETVHAKNYRGVGEDFHYLNQFFFDEKHLFNRDKLRDRSFLAVLGTTAVSYFGISHGEPFNREVYDFLADRVFPVIDSYITSKSPNTLRTAEKIDALVRDFLGQDDAGSSSPSPDGIQSGGINAGTGSPENSGAENAMSGCPEAENRNEQETASGGGNSDDRKPSEQENDSLPTGCDLSSSLAKEMAREGTHFTPPDSCIINEYRDTVTDLSHPSFRICGPKTGLYENTRRNHAPVISAYRNMFGSFLVSTARRRTLKTFSGRFNRRDAAYAAVSVNPRVFTRKEEGRQFGYDVSLLMDCSGSMGEFTSREKIRRLYTSV